jgi:hypothetical protein
MERRALAAILAALAGLTGCAHAPAPPPPAPVAPTQPVAAPSPAPPPPAPVEPPAPPARWARLYQRVCTDSVTAPVLAADGQSVASCGARFTLPRGRFVGAAPFGLLASLPGDRSLVDEHGGGGIALLSPGEKPVRAPGGRPGGIAIAPDGSKVVTLEEKDGDRKLVVRALPSLAPVREAALGKGPSEAEVAFLADGREAVLTSYPCVETACEGDEGKSGNCRQTKCSGRGIFAIDGGTPKPLVTGLRAGAFGARGDLAAVVREDGSAAIVALPDGRALAALPSRGGARLGGAASGPKPRAGDAGAEVRAIAVSAAGDRVAIAGDEDLAVLAQSGADFVEVLAQKGHGPSALRFAADGRTLFTGHDLEVYGEGAAPPETKPFAYAPKLPAGFVKAERQGNEWIISRDPEHTRLAHEDEIEMLVHPKLGAEATISRLDPEEFDPEGDAETWALRVAARLFPHEELATAKQRKKAGFTAWGERGERSFELHWVASGCEDVDNYERVSEKDGAIVRVHMQVYGVMTPKRAAPWLAAFFDDPLGKSPARVAVRERSEAKAKSAAKQRKAAHQKAKTARAKRRGKKKG